MENFKKGTDGIFVVDISDGGGKKSACGHAYDLFAMSCLRAQRHRVGDNKTL
jgi:hypothetical protein